MIRSLQPQKFRISPCQGRATTGGRSRALGERVAPRPPPVAAAAGPLQARAPPRAVPGRALRELRGGCSRRPGGRRREAVPQFVSNQGVRAVPRAGQQCVNKPTATPPPPRRARPAPAAAAAAATAGSALLAPARRAGTPPPAPLAPPLPRPAPAGAGSLTYRPTRARSRTTRPARPARIVASREQDPLPCLECLIHPVNYLSIQDLCWVVQDYQIWESRTTKRSDDQRSHDKSGC
ncbi:polycomb group RING finger protein 5 isoform X3 [Mirounga angustirostris]|uniref:polycomb group RING finger protein 5 isoform X3 n=1 Tax=Mirounga angustirostris TaxID=9716 RepID=UPI00313C2389